MRARDVLIFSILGICIGFINALLPYSIAVVVFFFLFYMFINGRFGRGEVRFLIRVSAVSFFILIGLSILGKMYGPVPNEFNVPAIFFDRFEFGDAEWIFRHAYNISEFAQGNFAKIVQVMPQDLPFRGYGVNVFYYWCAFLFYMFGPDALLPALTNIMMFNVSGLLVYSISKNVFCEKTARINIIIFLFFPSLMAWSISLTKDISLVFMMLAFIYLVLNFGRGRFRSKIFKLMLLIMLFFGLEFSRKGTGPIIVISTTLPMLAAILKKMRYRKFIYFCVCITAALVVVRYAGMIRMKMGEFYEKAVGVHVGYLGDPVAHNYKLLPDKYYDPHNTSFPSTAEYALMSLKGSFYFLLLPFPFDFKSRSLLLATLPMIWWYWLLLCAFIGLLACIKKKIRFWPVLFLPGAVILYVFGPYSGNIGTVFRHRDMLTPFCLFFASFGMQQLFLKKEKQSL